MARLLLIHLMIGFFPLLQITLSDIMSVHSGENITLFCNITNYSDIFWYHLTSEEVKLLLTAKEAKLGSDFSLISSVDENHFDLTNDKRLMITGVTETDAGFFFCVGRNNTHIQFGKPITLNFTDNRNQSDVSSAYLNRYQIINISLLCLCFISFLINFICMCVFRSRVQGKLTSSQTCCSDAKTHCTDEEMNLHYATFTHKREPPDGYTSYSDRVIYAGIRQFPV